ncbi:MAG: hypothetical protein KAW17_10760 [Candidatus Eisenbacteria sp.]|nr:hypothetical protein [Candidatus Eisenbacteria bacterium]
MKRLVALALAVAVIGLTGVAAAENDDECGCCGEFNMCEDTFEKGLEFGFSGLSNIGVNVVKKGSIGIKKWMGNDNYGILRFGFGMTSDTDEATQDGVTDYKVGSTEFDVAVGVQHNMGCCGNCLVPYVGGLVKVDRTSSYTEPTVQENIPAGSIVTTKTTSSTLGLDLMCFVGGEWFFTKCMSLSGEYTFGFGRSSTKGETEIHGADNTESKSSGWDFGPFKTANVRLTMYFE